MTVALYAGVAVLAVAAALTLLRMTRGPRMLDRAVAADVLLAIVMASIAFEAAINKHATTLPILVVIALVGFVGSVSMARFAATERAATLSASPPSDQTEEEDPDPVQQTTDTSGEQR